MSTVDIAGRIVFGIWACLMLWANFEAWFRPEKVMPGMRKEAAAWESRVARWPWLKSLGWYRALMIVSDVFAILVLYMLFAPGAK